MRQYVILVAGGKGLRMGGDVPKQFLPVEGRPVLMRTIDVFLRACPGIRVILVLPQAHQSYWKQLCQAYSFDEQVQIANGGETRFHSVANGLALIPDDEEAVVGVHDGVRPFVAEDTIRRCFAEAEKAGAVVPVVPVVETIRELTADGGSRTMDRNAYRLVQTPQTFRLSVLKEAYRQPYEPSFTDDASVVERAGSPVALVEGNRENIKITTPSDLLFAQSLCKI